MNGYIRSTHVYRRISNLIEQIPQPFRLSVAQANCPADGNIHDWERKLTGVCLRKDWAQISPDGVSSAEWFEQQPEVKF